MPEYTRNCGPRKICRFCIPPTIVMEDGDHGIRIRNDLLEQRGDAEPRIVLQTKAARDGRRELVVSVGGDMSSADTVRHFEMNYCPVCGRKYPKD